MKNLKLYWAPGACSFVAHSLLELAAANFEPHLLNLRKGEQNTPEYLALNPNGQVPFLTFEDESGPQTLGQIVAIVHWIDAQFPLAGVLPSADVQSGLVRAKAQELLVWMNNTAHPTFTHIFMPQKFANSDAGRAEIQQYAAQKFAQILDQLNQRIAALKTAYFFGNAPTAPDVYCLTLARWGTLAGILPTQNAALWALVERVAAHPAVARTIARERIVLDMSAFKVI